MIALTSFASPAPVQLHGDFQITQKGLQLSFDMLDSQKIVSDGLRTGYWDRDSLQLADGLWKSTCFEAFWSRPGESAYWELNLSAAGQWNLYYFNSYRKPQPPQPVRDFSVVNLRTSPDSLRCSLDGDFSQLDISLCAVIKTAQGVFYYSTAHKGDKPDFHLRESFILRRKK